jgi:hypothetical protein
VRVVCARDIVSKSYRYKLLDFPVEMTVSEALQVRLLCLKSVSTRAHVMRLCDTGDACAHTGDRRRGRVQTDAVRRDYFCVTVCMTDKRCDTICVCVPHYFF